MEIGQKIKVKIDNQIFNAIVKRKIIKEIEQEYFVNYEDGGTGIIKEEDLV